MMHLRLNIFLATGLLVLGILTEAVACENFEQHNQNLIPPEIGASTGQLHFLAGLAIPDGESKGEMIFLQLERMFDHRFSIRSTLYSEWSGNAAGFSQSGFGLGLAWHLVPQQKLDYAVLLDSGVAFADLISSGPDVAWETALGFAFDYHLDSYHLLQLQYRLTDSPLDGRNLSSRRRRSLWVLSWGFLF